MEIQMTARHFKARPELQAFAEQAVNDLTQIYDGIVSADIVLELEPHEGGKIAEIGLMVYHDKLFAKAKSDDFNLSVQACVDKLERQLRKYKDKLYEGRQPHEKAETIEGEEEEF